jgi:hypothetical protein
MTHQWEGTHSLRNVDLDCTDNVHMCILLINRDLCEAKNLVYYVLSI